MPQTQLIELPQSTVTNNLDHLSRLWGNETWDRRLHGQSTLQGDVGDLFYFFDGFPEYLRGFVRVPKLRPYHDRGLYELGNVLGGLNLMSENEVDAYEKFKYKLESGKIRLSSEPTFAALEAYRLASQEITYEALKGKSDFSHLRSDNLQKHLIRRRKMHVGFAAGPAALGLAAYKFTGNPLLGLLFALATARLVILNYSTYPPPVYRALSAKAERADRFVEYYLHELRR